MSIRYYGYRVQYIDFYGNLKGKTVFVTTQNKLKARTKAIQEYGIPRDKIKSLRFCSC